jgi:hypothetical protein
MKLEDAKNLATILGVIIALVTLIKGVMEYSQQGAQKRADSFIAMRNKLKENEVFKRICALIETDNPELEKIPFADKRDFLGFFEEVALMMNSGLINKRVAHYMFGYYALRCWESKYFWISVNKDSIYWAGFRDFVGQMQNVEKAFKFNRRSFRF